MAGLTYVTLCWHMTGKKEPWGMDSMRGWCDYRGQYWHGWYINIGGEVSDRKDHMVAQIIEKQYWIQTNLP